MRLDGSDARSACGRHAHASCRPPWGFVDGRNSLFSEVGPVLRLGERGGGQGGACCIVCSRGREQKGKDGPQSTPFPSAAFGARHCGWCFHILTVRCMPAQLSITRTLQSMHFESLERALIPSPPSRCVCPRCSSTAETTASFWGVSRPSTGTAIWSLRTSRKCGQRRPRLARGRQRQSQLTGYVCAAACTPTPVCGSSRWLTPSAGSFHLKDVYPGRLGHHGAQEPRLEDLEHVACLRGAEQGRKPGANLLQRASGS